ncbi:MAG: P-II family nitrogen regulator [Rhodothermales bacterium]|nr:P-II family nitrogen regulator [Rhodothermales bacterium]
MKLIKAIIRPEKLSDVLLALFQRDIRGLTVSRVRGHGGEREEVETYRGTTVRMELTDKIMLDIGVSESYLQATVDAILGAAQTGEVGDGKIFVLPVEKVYRIRTGEEDHAAVTPVDSD